LSNGSPDVFSAFSALSHRASSLGLTSLLGGGVFVTTLVVGAVSVSSPSVQLTRRPFLRDGIVYSCACLMLFLIVLDGKVHLWESIIFVGSYILYITGVIIARYIRQRSKKLRREALGIIEDSGEELYEVNDRGEDALPLLDDILFITNVRSWSSSSKFYHKAPTSVDNHELGDSNDEDDENEDDVLQQRPSVKKYLKNFWYRALSSIGWAELSMKEKGVLILIWPIAMIRALTVPSAGPEGQWLRPLAVISPITVPLLGLVATKEFFTEFVLSNVIIPLWGLFLGAGICLAFLVFLTTSNTEPPRYYMVFVVMGFISSTIWMYIIATEVICLIRALGVIGHMSQGILGLTVIAWATSIIDLVANVVVSRQGFTDMAIGACFGAPTFSLLLGMGISVTYMNIKNYPEVYQLHVTADLWIGFLFIGIGLVSILTFIPVNNFTTSHKFGIYLMVLYALFSIVSVLNEIGVTLLPFV